MRAIILALIGALSSASCSSDGIAVKFYVVIKPDETSRFLDAIRSIAKEDGLVTAGSQAVTDTGYVMRVVEGRGRGSMLWIQNVSLSGKEDPKLCGVPVRVEPYPDPAQFMVFTEPRFFGSMNSAKALGEKVLSQLKKSGFDVRLVPVVCGAAANAVRRS